MWWWRWIQSSGSSEVLSGDSVWPSSDLMWSELSLVWCEMSGEFGTLHGPPVGSFRNFMWWFRKMKDNEQRLPLTPLLSHSGTSIPLLIHLFRLLCVCQVRATHIHTPILSFRGRTQQFVHEWNRIRKRAHRGKVFTSLSNQKGEQSMNNKTIITL